MSQTVLMSIVILFDILISNRRLASSYRWVGIFGDVKLKGIFVLLKYPISCIEFLLVLESV